MERFSSLKQAPAETRRLLRDRFARYLPSQQNSQVRAAKKVTLPDEALLQLFLNLDIQFASEIESARATYMAALPPNSDEPNLEELIATGWFRVIWGRISMASEVSRSARSLPAGSMTAFTALLANRFEQTYRVADAVRSVDELDTVIAAMDRSELALHDVGCQTPEWVAARLWDRAPSAIANPAAALRIWVDRWHLLGSPSVMPYKAWNEGVGSAFREATIGVLSSDLSLVDWDEFRNNIIKLMALGDERPPSSFEGFVPPVPITLVDRAMWLDDHSLERIVKGMLFGGNDIFGPVRLLLDEIEALDHTPFPHRIFDQLIRLGVERPELLLFILFRARLSSVLCVDLLLYPPTSALACLLIAQWNSQSSAWDRELTTRDNQITKSMAFTDAVSVLGYFLAQASVNPKEAASLLDWLHRSARPGFIGDLNEADSMLTALRNELVRQSPESLHKMVGALTLSMPKFGLGTSTFAAALDIVDAGKLAGDIEPTALITAYIQSVEAGAYTLSANRVGVGSAVALVEMAVRATPELRQKFFIPLDIKARLAAAEAAHENPYTVADTLAKSIRAHVRILCRAVACWSQSLPDDLLDALISSVRSGALSHVEKGRVAAFSARYESGQFHQPRDRPIAADIGAALVAAVDDQRDRLLAAVLETDEPMMLAQLLSFAPHIMRARIENRIRDLTPSAAGEIHSLTEAQARIEELLSAGLPDVAAQFMEVEQNLRTMGNVGGREMMRLRSSLRLQLLRRDWTGIASVEPPPNLSAGDQASALETIAFFKAIAALSNPEGDHAAAEQMFAQLQRRHSSVVAYAVNLFAARLNLLLGDDLFKLLHGSALVQGRQILADAEQMMLLTRAAGPDDFEIYNCNRALLLLALGQPEQASGILASLHAKRLHDRVAAYDAVALARMGRGHEANAVLQQAVHLLGNTDVLRAAQAHISSGKPYSAVANILSDDDPIPRIKAALWDLRQMDHVRQAAVLQSPPESFDEFVIDHVRAAAASVTSLVPMMRGIDIDSSEDDLSALIRELLTARFLYLGWSVPDQSKGGYSALGNPGERDLLLQKGSTILAAIEAVVCRPPVSNQNLTKHFKKLLGYANCSLFFHLTYAYVEKPASVLDYLRQTAESDAPAGFRYLSRDEIPHTDSRPVGFVARYAAEFGEVKVVFLVLDMSQDRQKGAAKAAAGKARRTKKVKGLS